MTYFIHSAIQTLFYYERISVVVDDIKRGECSFKEDSFALRTSTHQSSFTLSESELAGKYVASIFNQHDKKMHWHDTFWLLSIWNKDCLIVQDNQPIVKFENLMIWHELAMILGEDLLAVSFMAHPDRNLPEQDLKFTWPNVLGHNNTELNHILDQGVVDIHAHQKASADTFELTWLDMMNQPVEAWDAYMELNHLASPASVLMTNERLYDSRCLIQVAAILRFYIFRYLLASDDRQITLLKSLEQTLLAFDAADIRMRLLRAVRNGLEVEKRFSRPCTYQARPFFLDYAIRGGIDQSIYSVHAGERGWLYCFFYRYYRNNDKIHRIADYVYLYLLIKIRIRKEFVQTNTYFGLQNFQRYEHRKSIYCNSYQFLYPLYAVQSSLRSEKDALEARVTSKAYPQDDNFSPSLFFPNMEPVKATKENLRFVVHLIKEPRDREMGTRYGYRDRYSKELDNLIYSAQGHHLYPLVGLDAAGGELNCPPEVFGQVYRYARKRGLTCLTYHVGEDFTDLVDGLRHIEEAIEFLELDHTSRLGHALALGINAKDYYNRRQRSVVMDSQRLLDTLTWLLYKAKEYSVPLYPGLRNGLELEAKKLFGQIGYLGTYQYDEYYLSQKLRSDGWGQNEGNSLWVQSRYCQIEICKVARNLQPIRALHEAYRTNRQIIRRGKEVVCFEYPLGIEGMVSCIQQNMRKEIADKQITIECNPTSNVKIGPFDSYETHPIFQFKTFSSVNKHIPVAICTDDKGIFGTSLTNEFSLMASAMCRGNHNQKEVLDYLDEVRNCGWQMRF